MSSSYEISISDESDWKQEKTITITMTCTRGENELCGYTYDNVSLVNNVFEVSVNANGKYTYNIQDNTGDGSSVEYTDIDYLPNERVTNTTKEIGAINAEESSISIVLTKYKVYSEETVNFVVSTKFKKETLYKEFASVTLGSGITEIQISYAIGVAMNTEEYVPITIPTNNANTKPRRFSPPKMKIASNVTRVVSDVFIVRDNVEQIAWLMFCFISRFGYNVIYSRIRSKITTVSLIE